MLGVIGQGNSMFFTDPEFAKIAEDHNTTPAQISISWLVQRGIPPLPKSANVERMKSNKTVSFVAFAATGILRSTSAYPARQIDVRGDGGYR